MNTDTSSLVLDDLDVSGDSQSAYVVATADQTTNNNATRERYEEYMAATASRRVSHDSLNGTAGFQASNDDLLRSARTVRNMQSDFGGVNSLLKSLIDERERTSVENERLRGEIKRFKLDATISRKKKLNRVLKSKLYVLTRLLSIEKLNHCKRKIEVWKEG